jgi:hypothetical protein
VRKRVRVFICEGVNEHFLQSWRVSTVGDAYVIIPLIYEGEGGRGREREGEGGKYKELGCGDADMSCIRACLCC